MRTPKEVLHKLQFFVELLHGEVYRAEFVEQSQTLPKEVLHELQFFVELLHDGVYGAEFVEQS